MQRRQLSSPSLVALIALAAPLLSAETLSKGMVRSTSGTPLEQVWVQELGTGHGSMTKADGVFTFPLGKPTTLLLVKDNFRPQIILTTGTETDRKLSIVLHPESDMASLRNCRRQGHGLLPEIELGQTPQVHLMRGREVDFVAYTATYTKSGEVLGSMTGLHVAGLTPAPNWVKGFPLYRSEHQVWWRAMDRPPWRFRRRLAVEVDWLGGEPP